MYTSKYSRWYKIFHFEGSISFDNILFILSRTCVWRRGYFTVISTYNSCKRRCTDVERQRSNINKNKRNTDESYKFCDWLSTFIPHSVAASCDCYKTNIHTHKTNVKTLLYQWQKSKRKRTILHNFLSFFYSICCVHIIRSKLDVCIPTHITYTLVQMYTKVTFVEKATTWFENLM